MDIQAFSESLQEQKLAQLQVVEALKRAEVRQALEGSEPSRWLEWTQ